MSSFPDSLPGEAEREAGRREADQALVAGSVPQIPALAPVIIPHEEAAAAPLEEIEGSNPPEFTPSEILQNDIPPAEESLFARYEFVPFRPAVRRIPNFGHFVVFILLGVGGYLSSGLVILAAVHQHMFGVTTFKQAEEEIHYRLGSQAAWYLITLVFCVWIFPLLWQRSFFDGLEWRAGAAVRQRWRLFGAALACFGVALVDEIVLPGPTNTPIDQTFRMPGAVWLLFAFGVTLAPLIEEIAYRGFLLPALCTAYDWVVEQITGSLAPRVDSNGRPRWSMPAMLVASVVSSIPFALMHGDQTAYSLGPFLLLVCVSLVLSWVRLGTRSLAASVLVHSSYNLLLFSLMYLGTGGFKHLDKM
jgi:membrane protease YdiL (CAAX protease family)